MIPNFEQTDHSQNDPDTNRTEPIDRIIIECDELTNELLYLNRCGRFSGKEPDCHYLDELPGKASVREYMDRDTNMWYQCWDSIIRWYNGRLIRLEIAINITTQKKIEHQITQMSNLRERLFTPKPLPDKLQDITDTAIILFDLSFSCIWLFQNIIDLSCISFIQKESWTQYQKSENQKLILINSSSKCNKKSDFISSLTTFSGHIIEKQVIQEKIEIENREDFIHSFKLFISDQTKKFNLHHSDIFPLINISGKTIGYVCSFRENDFLSQEQQFLKNLAYITSQVIISDMSMQAHIRTMEKYQVLIENLPLGVFLKDNDLRYLSCNKRFASDANVELKKIFGKTDYEIFPDSLAEISAKLDKNVLITKETRESVFEFIQNERIKWIESIRTPLIDPSGNVSGILGIMHDITKRKLAEEELQCLYNELEVRVEARTEELLRAQEAFHQANRKLNLLNSITRHDILNQITALYGYMEFIREMITDTMALEYLDKAKESARMIHDQITFTKLYQDIGIHAPLWQPVRRVISRVMKGICPETIAITLSLRNIEVYADPLLEKVFYTLIENTIRHGKDVSHIHFREVIIAGSLILIYEDNGVGIEPENKTLIFERGFGKNTGLGLFLAAEILNITNSSISETGEFGKGARFEVVFQQDRFRIYSE